MKKIILIVIITFYISVSSQTRKDEYGFDYSINNNQKILAPTCYNILSTFSMPPEVFEELMEEYGYKSNSLQIFNKNINNKAFRIAKSKSEKKEQSSIAMVWINYIPDFTDIEKNFENNFTVDSLGNKKYYLIKEEYKLHIDIIEIKKKKMITLIATFEI